jgi:hypothetical protein
MLPFTAEALFALVARYNQALWPAPPLVLALGLLALLPTLRPARAGCRPADAGDRAVAAFLALAWLWVGVFHHGLRFAAINFAAPAYGALFVLEGLLLAWSGVVRGGLAFRARGGPLGRAGFGLAAAALVLLPLADGLSGRGWWAVRLVGLAPEPTAAFTLGMLLLARGRATLPLAVLPLLWTLVAGVTAWILAIPQDLALPALGLGAFALLLARRLRG